MAEEKSPDDYKPFVLPDGYRWADERDEEEITPQDATRKSKAEEKRARRFAKRAGFGS
jgi:hypothetical protein